MKEITKRSILRWVHIVFGLVPILGYIYSPIDKVSDYATPTRYIFVPILLLTGYWMYSGALFASIAVVLWLGAFRFSGYGAAS